MTGIREFELHGACCANGIIRAKKAIAGVNGAGRVKVDLLHHVARVEGNPDPDAVVAALKEVNFEASFVRMAEWPENIQQSKERPER